MNKVQLQSTIRDKVQVKCDTVNYNLHSSVCNECTVFVGLLSAKRLL